MKDFCGVCELGISKMVAFIQELGVFRCEDSHLLAIESFDRAADHVIVSQIS
jgi:hypothetical protein